ncbi:MAG: hypothetical protein VW493_10200, partial [Gammaproteobacteria bacterium]
MSRTREDRYDDANDNACQLPCSRCPIEGSGQGSHSSFYWPTSNMAIMNRSALTALLGSAIAHA